MGKTPREWFKQAEYDMKSALIMFENRRYIHAVFLCHLSIEKALKGLYTDESRTLPPKTHNLVFLVEKLKIEIPEILYDFIFTLNGVSVPTRYPDELKRLQKDYNKNKTFNLLEKGKETLQWLKAKLSK